VTDQEEPPQGTQDLADKAMSWIDQVVDTLHDRVVVAVALAVMLLRLLDVYVFPNHQWASWALLGLICTVAGLVIWRYRRTPARASSA